MTVLVLTVDQHDSRHSSDRVPAALDLLSDVTVLRAFERTAGDEFQGVLDDPAAVAPAVERLLRDGAWSIGIGVGPVDLPLPAHARAGSGPAYVHARAAVSAAKSAPWPLCVRGDAGTVRSLESALWLWAAVLARRTPRGWEVADLLGQGLSHAEAGERLGISQSAVSQRARAAGIIETQRARELVTQLAVGALGEDAAS